MEQTPEKMTINEAKKDLKARLDKDGIAFTKLKGKSVSFAGFGYGEGLFISIEGAVLPAGWIKEQQRTVPKASEGGYIINIGEGTLVQREDGSTFIPVF